MKFCINIGRVAACLHDSCAIKIDEVRGRLKTFQTAFLLPESATIPFLLRVQPMKKTAPKSFEEAIQRLETLTAAMQSSDMPLEDALAAYQEGNELVKYCQAKLAEVEQKLQALDGGELKELNLDD